MLLSAASDSMSITHLQLAKVRKTAEIEDAVDTMIPKLNIAINYRPVALVLLFVRSILPEKTLPKRNYLHPLLQQPEALFAVNI